MIVASLATGRHPVAKPPFGLKSFCHGRGIILRSKQCRPTAPSDQMPVPWWGPHLEEHDGERAGRNGLAPPGPATEPATPPSSSWENGREPVLVPVRGLARAAICLASRQGHSGR